MDIKTAFNKQFKKEVNTDNGPLVFLSLFVLDAIGSFGFLRIFEQEVRYVVSVTSWCKYKAGTAVGQSG
jgi:hypothetical protein